MKAHIDHIAFRVADLEKAIHFYTEVMGCEVADRFFVDFDDGTKARCAALNAGPIQIFVSEGIGDGGVVKEWVKKHGNAIHHIAYAVDDLPAAVEDARKKGVEFLSEKQIENDDLIQIFTRPNEDTGVIHELIQRKHPDAKGFATENVKKLMDSTRDLK
jgi:methylmalonyl-CoA/ethylmalonyl-CoA epimerase